MKKLYLVGLLVALSGCFEGENDAPSKREAVATPMSGSAYLVDPLVSAQVEIFTLVNGQRSERIASTTTDNRGNWSTNLGGHSGDYLVSVSGGGLSQPLFGLAPGVKLVDGAAGVMVSPITHLTEAYAQYLIAQGKSVADAAQEAQKQLQRHFAGVDAARVRPWVLPPERAGAGSVTLSEDVLASLLSQALDQLARRMGEKSGLSQGSNVTLETLLAALVQDVRADGLFDGIGPNGSQLRQAAVLLSGDTLRADLAVALARFIESPRNTSGLGRNDLDATIKRLAASQLQIFPTAPSELHLDPPSVDLLAPANDAYLSGSPAVTCQAKSSAPLDRLEVWAERNGQRLEPLEVEDLKLEHGSGTITALLPTMRIPDGALSLVCAAADVNDNEQRVRISVTVNNVAAQVVVLGVKAGAEPIKGMVDVGCRCEGDPEATSCRLVAPDVARLQVRDNGLYRWNTLQEKEGPINVVCQSESPGLPPVTNSVTVFIDNLKDGQACGHVFLESPVKGGLVRAFAYTGGIQGDILGTPAPVANDGSFCAPIADTYAGPVLLTAGGLDARYANAITGAEYTLNTTELRLVLDGAVPNQNSPNLSINAATTLAAYLVHACVHQAPADLQDPLGTCTRWAHESLAKHLSPNVFNIRQTPVRDFVTTGEFSRAVNDEPTLLGLLHVGLARLAAETSLKAGFPVERVTSAQMLELLVRDAEDLTFNGRTKSDDPIEIVGRERMNNDTFRGDLARAIARWLNNVPLGADRIGVNKTNLRSSDYASEGGILRVMTEDTSPLFPSDAVPRPYDDAGPRVVSYVVQTTEGQPVRLNYPQRGKFVVIFQWQDEVGVESTSASLPGHPEALQRDRYDSAPGTLRFTVDTTLLAAGAYQIDVVAVDTVGNRTPFSIAFTVDNTPPVVSLGAYPAWINGQQPVHLAGTVDKPIRSLRVSTDSAPSATVDFPYETQAKSFDVPYAFACDRTATIAIQVTDWAGNATTQTATVTCDSHAPDLHLSGSLFRHEFSGQTIDLSSASWPMTFQKFYNLMDYLPQHARDEKAQNLPTLRFTVEDRAQSPVGSMPDELRVEYRYQYQGTTTEVRDWESLQVGSDGEYAIPLAYQTLLPRGRLNLPHDVAVATNFIAQSAPTEQHLVEVRVTDLAGNVRTYSYPFGLDLRSPPVSLRGCTPSPALSRVGLHQGNLDAVYRPGFWLFGGSVSWRTNLPPESLAPQGGLRLGLTGGSLQSYVRELNNEVFLRPYDEKHHRPAEGAANRCCDPLSIGWESGQCDRIGRENSYPRSWTTEVYQPSMQASVMHITDQNGHGVPQFGPSTFLANGELDYNVAVLMGNDPLRIDDVPYAWEKTLDLRNRSAFQHSYRYGVERKFTWFDKWAKAFAERQTIRELAMYRRPMVLQVAALEGGVKAPLNVEVDESCSHELMVRWNIDQASAAVVVW